MGAGGGARVPEEVELGPARRGERPAARGRSRMRGCCHPGRSDRPPPRPPRRRELEAHREQRPGANHAQRAFRCSHTGGQDFPITRLPIAPGFGDPPLLESRPSAGRTSCIFAGRFWVAPGKAIKRRAYFRLADTPDVFADVEKWLHRRLRALHLKHWKRGTTVYRELRARGVSERAAGMAARFSRNWWRVAGHSALHLALPTGYFDHLGVPRLAAR